MKMYPGQVACLPSTQVLVPATVPESKMKGSEHHVGYLHVPLHSNHTGLGTSFGTTQSDHKASFGVLAWQFVLVLAGTLVDCTQGISPLMTSKVYHTLGMEKQKIQEVYCLMTQAHRLIQMRECLLVHDALLQNPQACLAMT